MQKTVFVVGAGASTEFGPTPVGDKLARDIERQLILEFDSGSRWPDGPISNAIARSGLTDLHLRAMSRLRNSVLSCASIDQFVYEWQEVPHLPEIAKLCIAYVMLQAERGTSLATIQRGDAVSILRALEDCWLARALSRLNPTARRRDVMEILDGVSFVTFNYDRCIEKYLRESFMSTYGMTLDQAEKAGNLVPILHVYGDLGRLPEGAAGGVEYGAPDSSLWRAAHSIKTYMEEVDSNHARRIQALIQEADKIIFLGCAFHPQNLDLLFPSDTATYHAQVWGTAFQMRPPAIAKVRARIPISPLTLKDIRCGALLEGTREAIFED